MSELLSLLKVLLVTYYPELLLLGLAIVIGVIGARLADRDWEGENEALVFAGVALIGVGVLIGVAVLADLIVKSGVL